MVEQSPATAAATALPAQPASPRTPRWVRSLWTFSSHNKLGAAAGALIVAMWIVAIFAPLIAPYDADEAFAGPRLAGPSADHWLGTDEVGRDVFSRLVVGSRLSLGVSLAATVVGIVGACIVGLTSGYALGKFDLFVQRAVDAFLAMPILVVLMVIAFVTGGGLMWVTLAVALVTIPASSRIIRAQTLTVMQNDFPGAAQALGATATRVIIFHVVPNVIPTALVLIAIQLGQNILLQSSLSFLGLVSSQTPDWGSMLNTGARRYMEQQPWLALAPGAVIAVMVLAYNLLGDALRDALDPRLRGSR
ncbi:MAG: ABC transporter permease [Dehalococcoidia bacterium]|nr:ABC transporter permease [Dehalococcoidia bacterium]